MSTKAKTHEKERNPAKSISDSAFRKTKDSNRKTARKSKKDIICVSQQKDLRKKRKKCVNFVSETHKFSAFVNNEWMMIPF
jgi:hypothetical protein